MVLGVGDVLQVVTSPQRRCPLRPPLAREAIDAFPHMCLHLPSVSLLSGPLSKLPIRFRSRETRPPWDPMEATVPEL